MVFIMRILLVVLFAVLFAVLALFLTTQPFYYFTTEGYTVLQTIYPVTMYHSTTLVHTVMVAWGVLGASVACFVPLKNS